MYVDLPYAWEGDEGVIQQLVFEDKDAFEAFKEKLPDYKNTPDGSSKENGKGALLKLRAVRMGDGRWEACIRSGENGSLLVALGRWYSSPGEALGFCFSHVHENRDEFGLGRDGK